MRDILPVVEKWLNEGKKVAIATVVKVYGSAPQGLGSKMAVNEDGLMAGSVSGGCVEGAVVEEALQALRGNYSRLVVYGITNEMVIDFGLACGGNIEVFVEPLSMDGYSRTRDDLLNNRLALKITALTGKHLGKVVFAYPETISATTYFSPASDEGIRNLVAELLKTQINQRITMKLDDEEVELFCEVIAPVERLMIVGAVHIAIPLVTYANRLGFHTIVVDPRKAFSNRERFPHTDELVTKWPDESLEELGINESSYLVIVSHDIKLDIPALAIACRSKARYVGVLGSRKTFENYKQALREEGLSDEEMVRIHSPIGLKIGAQGAEEIALAIMAELIAVRNGVLQ